MSVKRHKKNLIQLMTHSPLTNDPAHWQEDRLIHYKYRVANACC